VKGRPLKWETPEKLDKLIDDYFKSISYESPLLVNGKEVTNRLGELIIEVIYVKRPTITGLSLYLDTSRKVLMEYENRDNFSNTIKKAKTMIERFYEEGLMSQHSTGAIFALKNFGWTDKQEIEHTGRNVIFENE